MKKILSLVLALVLTLSLMFVMTACGGEDADAPVSQGETQNDVNAFPEALTNLEALAVEGVDYTGWTLSGGMVDGVEMEEADVSAILDACGGKMEFYFLEAGKINLSNGEKTFEGTYTLASDGYIVDAVFEGYEYYGVFTPINDVKVLVIVNKEDNTTALYFTQIDEH